MNCVRPVIQYPHGMTGRKTIQFADLFAGIGGFHVGITAAARRMNRSAKCIFACDISPVAKATYLKTFSEHLEEFDEKNFFGDITDPATRGSIPDGLDILCAGFPCQPFSLAGRRLGFFDKRGTLFEEIERILKDKGGARPKAVFLENVRNLIHHDKGNTFSEIGRRLRGAGYNYDWSEAGRGKYWAVLRASAFGVPTHRPRIYMVAFRDDLKLRRPFEMPVGNPKHMTLRKFFGKEWPDRVGYTLRVGGKRSGVDDRRNWDAYRLANGRVQFLTARQGMLMMGFRAGQIKFPGLSDRQILSLLGNSVAVPVISGIAGRIIRSIDG